MEEREGAGGGKRDAFTSRILYIQLSRNREFLDRRSSTDRKIEGKRSSLKKKKKKGKSFFFPSHVILPLFIQRFRFIQLLNRFVAYSEIIVSWMRFVHRDKSSFSRRRRIIYRNFSIVIHFEFQQEKIKRNYIPSYGILFKYIFFSNTNVKYWMPTCLTNRWLITFKTRHRNGEKIKTSIRDNLSIILQSTSFTFILLSQIQGRAIKAFDSYRQPGSKVSEASSGSRAHIRGCELVRRCCAVHRAHRQVFFERCGCGHPTRQKSV